MGTKGGSRARTSSLSVRVLQTDSGRVGQVLYPYWIDRSDVREMGMVLAQVERALSSEAPHVSVVVTGGGLFEINSQRREPRRWWLSEAGLDFVMESVTAAAQPVGKHLRSSARDYLVGFDVTDADGRGVGQFALLYCAGHLGQVIWKSYPVEQEDRYLAGFGTEKGRQSPRAIDTRIGKTMALVCHDAQAFNHFNQSRMRDGTDRSAAVDQIHALMKAEKPVLALNLVHYIDKEGSIRNVFLRSYRQMHEDWPWHPSAVGAFGYERTVVRMLPTLAEDCQWPVGTVGCTLAVEPGAGL